MTVCWQRCRLVGPKGTAALTCRAKMATKRAMHFMLIGLMFSYDYSKATDTVCRPIRWLLYVRENNNCARILFFCWFPSILVALGRKPEQTRGISALIHTQTICRRVQFVWYRYHLCTLFEHRGICFPPLLCGSYKHAIILGWYLFER